MAEDETGNVNLVLDCKWPEGLTVDLKLSLNELRSLSGLQAMHSLHLLFSTRKLCFLTFNSVPVNRLTGSTSGLPGGAVACDQAAPQYGNSHSLSCQQSLTAASRPPSFPEYSVHFQPLIPLHLLFFLLNISPHFLCLEKFYLFHKTSLDVSSHPR